MTTETGPCGDQSPLLRAVAVLDQLRSPGGCPWDAEQTHASLRRYLLEEVYELLDAIESGDRAELREELGDVLLQVLFHARVAAEHETDPFDIDDVAAGLADKLVARHPHVFADAAAVTSADEQDRRWHELKHAQKRRESLLDGVPTGQPAAALVGKLAQRAVRGGVPVDLITSAGSAGGELFAQVVATAADGTDPETTLRDAAKDLSAAIAAAEAAARADGVDSATLDADGWRRYWTAT